MKKIFFVASLATIVMASSVFTSQALVPPSCKVQRFDCPGIGTGDKDTCITTGNSIACTTCGASSDCY